MRPPGGHFKLAERHLVDETPVVDGCLRLSTEQIRARGWPAGTKRAESEGTRSHQQRDTHGQFLDHLESPVVTVTFKRVIFAL